MDRISRDERSRLMGRIGPKDTQPELAVRRAIHARGLRYRLHSKKLPGRPDLVFPSRRLVIFVHGCFWHRHLGCSNCTTPRTRPEFWNAKFEANVARDTRIIGELKVAGWRVAIIWECETEKPDTLTARFDDIFGRARGLPPAL